MDYITEERMADVYAELENQGYRFYDIVDNLPEIMQTLSNVKKELGGAIAPEIDPLHPQFETGASKKEIIKTVEMSKQKIAKILDENHDPDHVK